LAYHEIADNQNQRAFTSPEISFDMRAFEAYLDQHPTWNAFTKDHVELAFWSITMLFPDIQASDHSIDCAVPRRVNLRLYNRIEMLLLDFCLRLRIHDNFSLLMTEAHMQETSSDPSQLFLIAVSTVAVLF
jgi:hypothetical protein